jgi:sugar/nucleoside kinase (ribokinase family)
MAPPQLVAVGDLMIDVTVDETALARGGHVVGAVRLRPGGSAANAAVWARAAGAAATVIGRVGGDTAGRVLRAALEEHGVQALVAADEEAPTGIFVRLGERVVAERGANAGLVPDDVPAELRAEAVLVSGFILLHDDSGPAAEAALARAAAPWVAVDAGSARLLDSYGRERFLAATERASLLLLNEDEAFALTDEEPAAAARALADFYEVVCVKEGPAGAVAARAGELTRAESPPVDVADPTGAGDAFAAALLVALSSGRALPDALTEACRAGAASAGSRDPWP